MNEIPCEKFKNEPRQKCKHSKRKKIKNTKPFSTQKRQILITGAFRKTLNKLYTKNGNLELSEKYNSII